MKKMFFLILPVFMIITLYTNGQFTREQANDLVLNQILQNEIGNVDVYSSYESQSGPGGLVLNDNTTIPFPYPENWVFFVDDMVFANWHHACRYIFISIENGASSIVNETFFPKSLETAYERISAVERPSITTVPGTSYPDLIEPVNPHLFAVIIGGMDMNRFFRDVSAIFCALTQKYGYAKENVFVHYNDGDSFQFGTDLDGDQSGDIDYTSEKTRIEETFRNLSGEWNTDPSIPELQNDDQLLIFTVSHGDIQNGNAILNVYAPIGSSSTLFDYEFADYVKNIHCAQIIFAMQQCNSGGFEDDLMANNPPPLCKNRLFYSACQANEVSWSEIWLTATNYDEFVYYWTSALRGYYPDKDIPWEVTYPVGTFIFPSSIAHPNYDPDLNQDGIVQMEEAFDYANNHDTYSPYGYYNPFWAFPGQENPIHHLDILFQDDLMSLMGLTGTISTGITLNNRSFLIGGELKIPGSTFISLNHSKFFLGGQNSKITVDPGGTLDSYFGTFAGGPSNKIDVNGTFSVAQGGNVEFNRIHDAEYFDGLYMNYNSDPLDLHNATFHYSDLNNYTGPLSITNSTFENCPNINSHLGDVTVSSSGFVNTRLYLANEPGTSTSIATVKDGCTFTAQILLPAAIDIWNYSNFLIQNNFVHSIGTGIQVMQCGHGIAGNQLISNNTVTDCYGTGIVAYNSTGTIENNHVYHNYMGIRLLNNSNIKLSGNSSAIYPSQTQEIRDNSGIELYTTARSFPWYCRYNVFYDPDNLGYPEDPIVFCDYGSLDIPKYLYINYNCWDNNFNPNQDLYPTEAFIYQPTWCPGDQSQENPGEGEGLYNSGISQFEAGNYSNAKVQFESLVEEFPESKYAQSALTELFSLEKLTDNDYYLLKQYYLTNDSVLSDSNLLVLGNFLSNRCDVELENWPDAIGWYENVIQNPKSLSDSIFAIVDVGYIYITMENGGTKSTYTGMYPQFKPESREKFFEHRDSLLAMLPGDQLGAAIKHRISALSSGELLQNIPNPASEQTKIWFNMGKQGTVELFVFDKLGRKVISEMYGSLEKGYHNVDLAVRNLQPGAYILSLIINGAPTDSKKMLIVR